MPRPDPAPDALDTLPNAYAAWRRSTLGRITDALEERLVLDRLGPVRGLRVLDVGCGDGVLAVRLAAAGARVTGIDAAPAMLAAARARAAGVDLDLAAGGADHLPFPDRSFDAVLSVATLCFCADPAHAVGEMARVLRPGGRLVLGELASGNAWAALRRAKGWLGSSVWRAARFRSRRGLDALARGAGLAGVSVTGAVFYPPLGLAARHLAPLDARLGRLTTAGAAFLVLAATKPAGAASGERAT